MTKLTALSFRAANQTVSWQLSVIVLNQMNSSFSRFDNRRWPTRSGRGDSRLEYLLRCNLQPISAVGPDSSFLAKHGPFNAGARAGKDLSLPSAAYYELSPASRRRSLQLGASLVGRGVRSSLRGETTATSANWLKLLNHANLNSSALDRNFIDYLSGDEMNSKDAQDCSKLGSHPRPGKTSLHCF